MRLRESYMRLGSVILVKWAMVDSPSRPFEVDIDRRRRRQESITIRHPKFLVTIESNVSPPAAPPQLSGRRSVHRTNLLCNRRSALAP